MANLVFFNTEELMELFIPCRVDDQGSVLICRGHIRVPKASFQFFAIDGSMVNSCQSHISDFGLHLQSNLKAL